MTTYIVDEHHYMHTCPLDDQPHQCGSARRIIAVTTGGPCRAPVTIRLAGKTAEVACGRVVLPDARCRACQTIVWVRNTSSSWVGHHEPTGHRAADGYRPDPCPVCGEPVAANLMAHILCTPPTARRTM